MQNARWYLMGCAALLVSSRLAMIAGTRVAGTPLMMMHARRKTRALIQRSIHY